MNPLPHICSGCGQLHIPKPERNNWRRLNARHGVMLYKLLLAVRHYGRNDIHIRDDMKRAQGARFQITDDEWTNWGYLRYFGLAVHVSKENPRNGRWLLTTRGAQFLKGEIPIPKAVRVIGGHRAEEEAPERVYLRDLAKDASWYSAIPDFDIWHPERVEAPAVRQMTLINQ